jgi:hypothetical protein
VGGAGEVHTEFWWGYKRKRDNLEGLDIYGRIILNGTSRLGVGRLGVD